MNRIKTDVLGGMPFLLDDIEFLQDNLIKGLESIIKALVGEENCRLWGCEITSPGPNTFEVSEGFVWLDGEILYVPAQHHYYNDPYEDCRYGYIIKEISETEPRIFKDGSTKNVWELRQGKLIADCEWQGEPFIRYDTPYLIDLIKKQNSPWQNAVLENGWSSYSDHELRYRKTVDNYLTISGVVLGNNATDRKIFTLPIEFRPQKEYLIPVVCYDSTIARLIIQPDGAVRIYKEGSSDFADSYFIYAHIPLD